MTAKQRLSVSIAGVLIFASGSEAAWLGTGETQLYASNPDLEDDFGHAMALAGDTLVVGAYSDDHAAAVDAGSAYVFQRSGISWNFVKRLKASDASAKSYFGTSVATDGETIVIGAHGDDTYAGAAYVFVRDGTTWVEQQKLVPDNSAADDWFGCSVAVEGDTVLVGAENDDVPGNLNIGLAYVFVRAGTDWSQQAKLMASDAEHLDGFGHAVALSGETAFVGATGSQVGAYDGAGAVYVFARSGTAWAEQEKLSAGDPSAGAGFGDCLASSGEALAVGATSGGTYHGGEGAAYVFVREGTGWIQQAKLDNPEQLVNEDFGTSVAISGDTLLVGAPWDSPSAGVLVGAAHRFSRSGPTWGLVQTLVASDGEHGDTFGGSVAIDGDEAFVGAPNDEIPGGVVNTGSVYVFALSPYPPTSYCTAGTSASGCQALLAATGTPSASAASGFTLHTSAVEGAKDGMFFWGTSGQQANPWGNGTSFACVAPPLARGGLLAGGGTNGACDGAFAQDLNALWCPTCPKPQKNPGAAAVVQAQLWYRDPQSSSNNPTSLSDAIEFCVEPR
jgi:hypothetical protein